MFQKTMTENDLFPNVPITKTAYEEAQRYINASIEVLGLSEVYMYGFRKADDPSHAISTIYFPRQKCSAEGVQVEPHGTSAQLERFHKLGLVLNSWIHHHVYMPLRPSSPPLPVNDEDNNIALLNLVGTKNFKPLKKRVSLDVEGSVVMLGSSVLFENLQIKDTKERYGLELEIAKNDLSFDRTKIVRAEIEIPINYSYIYCIIMNPNVEPHTIGKRVSRNWNRVVQKIDTKYIDVASNEYQQNILVDPYAGVALRRWSDFLPAGDEYRLKQRALEIIPSQEAPLGYDTICAIIKDRARRGFSQWTAMCGDLDVPKLESKTQISTEAPQAVEAALTTGSQLPREKGVVEKLE